jgi:hypothetical protein
MPVSNLNNINECLSPGVEMRRTQRTCLDAAAVQMIRRLQKLLDVLVSQVA